MIMNRIFFKLIMLLIISGFIFSGCGWEDDTDDAETAVKSLKFISASHSTIYKKGTGTDQLPEITELVFQALDEKDNSVKGLKIPFALSTEGKVNNVTLSSQYCVTDANGLVKVLATAGDIPGAFTVKASTGDLSVTSESIKVLDIINKIEYISSTSSTIAIKNSGSAYIPEYSKVSFQVIDANGDVAKNAKISFTLSSAGVLNGVMLSTSEAVSDEKGLVEVNVFSGYTTGAFKVTAAYNDIFSSSEEITITSNIGSISFISALPSKIAAKGFGSEQLPESTQITFQIMDEKGAPVKSASIDFVMSSDGILNEVVLSSYRAISDEKGLVSVTASAGTKKGNFSVKALYKEISSNSDILSVISNVENISFLSALPSIIMIKGAGTSLTPETSKVSFSVKDKEGNAYPNAKITFSLSDEGLASGATLASSSGITDANGTVEVAVLSGSRAANFEVKASYDAISTGSTTITVASVDVKEIKFISSTPSTIAIRGLGGLQIPEYSKLTFQVIDGNGNAAKNVKVQFALSTLGIMNGVKLSTLEATSNELGLVEVTALSGEKSGDFSVTASHTIMPSNNIIKATSNPLTVTSNIAKLTYVSANPAKLVYNQTTALTFAITDITGAPLQNIPINFALSSDGVLNNVTLLSTTAISNESGLVQVSAVAGAKTGSFSVTASYKDVKTTSASIAISKSVAAIKYISATPLTLSTGGKSTILTFEIRDAMGEQLPNAQIDFSLSAEGVLNNIRLSTSMATSNGYGLVQVTAYSGWSEGKFSVTASYRGSTEDGVKATSDEISVINNNVKSIIFKSITNSTIAIVGHGNDLIPEKTKIIFKAVDASSNSISGVNVRIAISPDGAANIISGSIATSDANGDINVEVTSGANIVDFKVVASLDGDDSVKAETTPITITSNTGKAINFISAEPTLIALKGTGGADLSETSALKFKVVDERQFPVPGITVNFALSTTVGGIGLSLTSGNTDSNGEIIVNVTSGNMPTSVTVIASMANDPNIRSISGPIAISTGRPSVNHFTIGPVGGFHAVGAWGTNGIEKEVSVMAADRFFHPVPDGTAVALRTEWGLIDPVCYTTNGACSVKWRSNGDPAYFTDSNQNIQKPLGRITVMASVTNGEENFVDKNSNGIYDSADIETTPWDPSANEQSEAFVNTGEVVNAMSKFPGDNGLSWRGYNKATDEFIDDSISGYPLTGVYGIWNEGNKIYNGKLCSDELAGVSKCSKELVRVWGSNVILATPPEPAASCSVGLYDKISGNLVSSINLTGLAIGASKSYVLEVKDSLGNPLPGATSISFSGLNAAGEAVELSVSVNKLTIPETASIGFGATLFNFSVFRTSVQKVQVSVKISGSGESEFNIPVTEPIT